MYEKRCLSTKEAYNILQCNGYNIGYDKLRAGLVEGEFPFGFSVSMNGNKEFVIFKKDLIQFMESH